MPMTPIDRNSSHLYTQNMQTPLHAQNVNVLHKTRVSTSFSSMSAVSDQNMLEDIDNTKNTSPVHTVCKVDYDAASGSFHDLHEELNTFDMDLRLKQQLRNCFSIARQFEPTQERQQRIESLLQQKADAYLHRHDMAARRLLQPYINDLIKLHTLKHMSLLKADYTITLGSNTQYFLMRKVLELSRQGFLKNTLEFIKMFQASPFGLMLYSQATSSQNIIALKKRCLQEFNTLGHSIYSQSDQAKTAGIFLQALEHIEQNESEYLLKDEHNIPFGFNGIDGPSRKGLDISFSVLYDAIQDSLIQISDQKAEQTINEAFNQLNSSLLKQKSEPGELQSSDHSRILENTRISLHKENNFLHRFFYVPDHISALFLPVFDEIKVAEKKVLLDRKNSHIYNDDVRNKAYSDDHLVQMDIARTSLVYSKILINLLKSFKPKPDETITTQQNTLALSTLGFSSQYDQAGNSDLDQNINMELNSQLDQPYELPKGDDQQAQKKNDRKFSIKRMEAFFDKIYSKISINIFTDKNNSTRSKSV